MGAVIGERGMIMRKTEIMAALLLIVALFPPSNALGGGTERSVGTPAKEVIQSKQLALSLRIAAAKGKNSSRKHFRSLLRHNKRKPLRNILKGHAGILRAR